MILDALSNADRYTTLHPGFTAAFAYLRNTDFTDMSQGRHEIDGERLFCMLGREPGQGREKRKLEFHRQYIDIQYVHHGADEIGWRAASNCDAIDEPYEAKRDVGFYAGRPETYFTLQAGVFVIFWPEDPHAPLSGLTAMIKPVVKVLIDWK